jgi:hypothetical protein
MTTHTKNHRKSLSTHKRMQSTHTNTQTSLLRSYLIVLAEERHVDCEKLTIAVDNAHCMLKIDDDRFTKFPGSVSAHSYSEDSSSRWMESSSSSDFSLSVPWRSPDIVVGSEEGHRKNFLRHPSMDTTERWLRELPVLEGNGSKIDGSPRSPHRVKSFEDHDDDDTFNSDTDEDMPLLKGCRFGKDEKHPIAKLGRFDRGGGLHFRKIDIDSREDSISQCARTETTEGNSSSKSQNSIPKRNDYSKGAVLPQDIEIHRIPTKPRTVMEDESLHEIVERKGR